jgi:hypothetical protein
MPYVDRIKTNNESGPAGPLNIDDARDWEITWHNGRAQLLQTPRAPRPQGEDMPETPKQKPDLTWDRGGANMGTIPEDFNWMDKTSYRTKDRRITEENMSMSYVKRLAMVMAAPLTFKDVLKTVKQYFPELTMKFPKPPTYVWNPKEAAEDEETKMDVKKIKDNLKIRLPQIKWTLRMMDGVEESTLEFADGSSVLFEIGANADQLTLTYTEPPKDAADIQYDDSEATDEEDEKDAR